ncbi:MAG: NAD(+) synthase [Syntrophomonadaceae bacterium]|nr:NAD(+) synthase [Syntrophomonadaceae bacterium]
MKPELVVQHLVDWLQAKVKEAGASGLVLGVSGGVDSAVAAVLAKKAFPDDCMALLLPCESVIDDRMDSQTLVEKFSIRYRIIDLDNPYRLLSTQFESYLKFDGAKGKLLRGNIKSRLRMMALYYSASARNYLVLGTSNKSEISVGYATKYGDGGVDIQVLGDLLKREVFELARYLEIPQAIIDKPPSGGLWCGQTDEAELGFTYEELDNYLSTGEAEPELLKMIQSRINNSEHKRTMPPLAIIPEDLRF